MSVDALRAVVSKLNAQASAVAAIGAALAARASSSDADTALRPHLDGVLEALDVSEAIQELGPTELRALLGEIRTFALIHVQLLYATTPGWRHTDPKLLEAAGDVSVAFPHALKGAIAPKLTGLSERLASPSASFLDIGVGVASLSIEMARLWPSLRVVGIDPWQPTLALAQRNLDLAGFSERIELRHQSGQELPDRDRFDLAWLPSLFVPEMAVVPTLQRVLRALVPGGWLIVPTLAPSSDRLIAPLASLRTVLFGGFVATAEQVTALLAVHGFVDACRLTSAPTSPTALVAARRP